LTVEVVLTLRSQARESTKGKRVGLILDLMRRPLKAAGESAMQDGMTKLIEKSKMEPNLGRLTATASGAGRRAYINASVAHGGGDRPHNRFIDE
jgi:hypothetical protein